MCAHKSVLAVEEGRERERGILNREGGEEEEEEEEEEKEEAEGNAHKGDLLIINALVFRIYTFFFLSFFLFLLSTKYLALRPKVRCLAVCLFALWTSFLPLLHFLELRHTHTHSGTVNLRYT